MDHPIGNNNTMHRLLSADRLNIYKLFHERNRGDTRYTTILNQKRDLKKWQKMRCMLRGFRLHRCPYWIRPSITVSDHSVLFSTKKHPRTKDLLLEDFWFSALKKGVMVFALPGEPGLTELAGDFKIHFHDRQGDFYCKHTCAELLLSDCRDLTELPEEMCLCASEFMCKCAYVLVYFYFILNNKEFIYYKVPTSTIKCKQVSLQLVVV
ncbi:hypothetical protein AHAS_Ahas08G0101900 [Arachis hypogaea]